MHFFKSRFWRATFFAVAAFIVAMVILNGQLLDAQWRYKTHSLGNGLRTQSASATPVEVSTAPEILIPKLNVAAPIIFSNKSDSTSMALALRNGTVHYPGTALPGQDGKVVIFGHSSGALWAPGSYKFVFTLLADLENGDQVRINYGGVQYTYVVYNKYVVLPTDFSVLTQTPNATLSLITCTPVGTSQKRLVVEAQQVVPDPAGNVPASLSGASTAATLPGN